MLARVHSMACQGVDAVAIEVEVDVSGGLPAVVTVGLPDSAVKESRDRVKSALSNSGYRFPPKRITINLAPADIKKEGSLYDLPIAVGLLNASGQIESRILHECAILGELALDGRVRPVPGALPGALLAEKMGLANILLPAENAPEAAVAEGIDVIPVRRIEEAVGFLSGDMRIEPVRLDTEELLAREDEHELDFSDVRGQEHVKRALTVASAGGHNIIMIGPPGSGKSMMAKRIPSILPRMGLDEAIETTKIHSVVGLVPPGEALISVRPFRSPHHTTSYAGLVGGGTAGNVSPGEISLAHNGVLFLDELPEFDRRAKEALRQPLEAGEVTVVRASGTVSFPARIMLIAAMNPCPCGYLTDPLKECRCTPRQVHSYLNRVSGPLLDRIDIHVDVPPVRYKEISAERTGPSSASIREEVEGAREVQTRRFREFAIHTNSRMSERQVREFVRLGGEARAMLKLAMTELGFSARAYTRILKVARTIADLDAAEDVRVEHIAEAIQYRSLDRTGML